MSPDREREGRPAEWTDCLPPASAIGSTVQTACGGAIQYSATTPCVIYQGKKVYFCLPLCKAVLESDPRHSCLTLYTGR
jgi:YHS domain-containing protein